MMMSKIILIDILIYNKMNIFFKKESKWHDLYELNSIENN